jgi:hypothetical protein
MVSVITKKKKEKFFFTKGLEKEKFFVFDFVFRVLSVSIDGECFGVELL